MTYLYKCAECGTEWEENWRSVGDSESHCLCGGTGKRQVSLSSFQLKGRKWEKKDGY